MKSEQPIFLSEYLDLINEVKSEASLQSLSQSLYAQWYGGAVEAGTHWLNRYLRVGPVTELIPVLPTTSVGSTRGLVVVSANPRFSKVTGQEKQSASRSAEKFWHVTRNLFSAHYLAGGVGAGQAPFWNKALRAAPKICPSLGLEGLAEGTWHSRLRAAGEIDLIGGWDVFPFHSEQDPFAPFLRKHPRDSVIRPLAEASINALLRLAPKTLLMAVSTGPPVDENHPAGYSMARIGRRRGAS